MCLTVDTGDAAADAGVSGDLYELIARELETRGLTILQERVFGSLQMIDKVLAARSKVLGRTGLNDGGPVTYIDGGPLSGRGLAGVQILACRSGDVQDVEVLRDGSTATGRVWHRSDCDVVCLSDVRQRRAGDDTDPSRQASAMFRRAEAILRDVDLSPGSVVRTWIYLRDILSWYDAFNTARNAEFRRMGLLDGQAGPVLPASTGIEGSNPSGTACTMDVLALRIRDPQAVRLHALHNPRQNEAFAYGSAFARGTLLEDSQAGYVFVSGTAAIDELGRSVCQGDAAGQIDYTLANVEGLLSQTGASPADICQATMFFAGPQHAGLYYRIAEARGWPAIPAVTVRADVCRPDLLFEIDAFACRGADSTTR